MNRNVQTAIVKVGKTTDIVGSGKYFLVLRASPIALVKLLSGENFNAVEGVEIEFDKTINHGTLSCPGATADITVQYYIGDFPFVGAVKQNPNGSISTNNWVTIGPVNTGNSLQLLGTLVLKGTTYRRKNITITNISGSGIPGAVAAAFAALQTVQSGALATKSNGAVTFNSLGFPLPPGNGFLLYPIGPIETDDDLVAVGVGVGNSVDLVIFQTWIPVIP